MKNRFFVYWILLLLTAVPALCPAANSLVQLETSYGIITIQLYDDKAPVTVANFLEYVNSGFYDDLIFHRVVKDFVIQAGAYDADLNDPNLGSGDPNYFQDPNWTLDPYFYHAPGESIINESTNGLKNVRGTVAMARKTDPNSANSQFFINLKANTTLDRATATDKVGYCVFGEVISGMDVVDAIAAVTTKTIKNASDTYKLENVPVTPVLIELATEYNPITITKAKVKAGKSRNPATDSFLARGTMVADPNELLTPTDITVRLVLPDGSVLLEKTIENAVLPAGKTRYKYTGSDPGIKRLELNLAKHTFEVLLKNVDLGGLKESVIWEMQIGDYFGLGAADEDLINGRKAIPIRLAQGYIDSLQVKTYRFVSNLKAASTERYSLTISGSLATAVNNPDLAGKEVTIKWGTKSFTIPSGITGLQKKGTRQVYLYQRDTITSGLTKAVFDLDNLSYAIYLKRTSLSAPPQDFYLKFETVTGSYFEETVSVAAP
ncbi:MAG: Peptidyl-prolyl cis-trans isomerase cyp18 [Planctomycetes bacterium ADurb.Bin412]|nr:MAG: Peptidyl-prolyl cis-trans isomerase cyp18 [Planctomycetes bacterium ADurb.Bin412]